MYYSRISMERLRRTKRNLTCDRCPAAIRTWQHCLYGTALSICVKFISSAFSLAVNGK
jgi:hypothetical protein